MEVLLATHVSGVMLVVCGRGGVGRAILSIEPALTAHLLRTVDAGGVDEVVHRGVVAHALLLVPGVVSVRTVGASVLHTSTVVVCELWRDAAAARLVTRCVGRLAAAKVDVIGRPVDSVLGVASLLKHNIVHSEVNGRRVLGASVMLVVIRLVVSIEVVVEHVVDAEQLEQN